MWAWYTVAVYRLYERSEKYYRADKSRPNEGGACVYLGLGEFDYYRRDGHGSAFESFTTAIRVRISGRRATVICVRYWRTREKPF